MRFLVAVFLFLTTWFFQSDSAWANAKDLKPGVKIQSYYDSNLFFNDDNRKSDFVTTLAPFIENFFRSKKATARVYAEPKFLVYAKNDDLNDVHYDLIANTEYELNKHWAITADTIHVKSVTTYISDDAIGATGRFDYQSNVFSPGVFFDSKKGTQFSAHYTLDRAVYDEPIIADSDGNKFEARLDQKITSKLVGAMNAKYEERHFDSGLEPYITLVSGGFRYVPEIRFSHEFLAGLEIIDQSTDSDSEEEFYYSYEFGWNVTRKDKLSVKSRKYSAIIDSQNNLLNLWQQTVSWARKLTRKDSIRLAFSYLRSKYDLLDQKENFYKVDVQYERMFSRSWALEINYAYDIKDADEPSTQYKRHVVFAGLTYKF